MDDIRAQLSDIKSGENQHPDSNTSVIIRNLPIVDDDNKLTHEVLLLFGDTLKIDVGVVSAERFKTYSDRISPVKVVLANSADRAQVMKNKYKLGKSDQTKKVRIEHLMTKADVINRNNWSTILNRLGDAGKDLRVVGSGRIVSKKDSEDGDGDRGPRDRKSAGGSRGGSEGDTGGSEGGARVQRSGKFRRDSGKGEEGAPLSGTIRN